jgi:hypothetical protein
MLESFQMGSFHTIVLVVAFVILLVILMVVGFGIKNTSKAVPFPPVPSSCPNKWTSSADLSGNPVCSLSDPNFNMPQIVAVGSKSVFSANGDQWTNTTISNINGLANVAGNLWLYTTTTEPKVCTIDKDGLITDSATSINTTNPKIATVNGVVYANDDATTTTMYIYGSNSSGKLAIQQIIYTKPTATAVNGSFAYGIASESTISGTVIGLAYKDAKTVLAITDSIVYSIMKPSSTEDWVWKSRGEISKTDANFTPRCITYADNRFFMGGETNGSTDATKIVIYSTAGNMPTGDLSWTPRAKSADIAGDVVGIIYTDNKRFIAISNQATATSGSDTEKATADAAATTIISSTNGSKWTSVAKGDKFIGGKAIGFRKNTTADKGLNVGSGFIKSVGNVKWDDAYSIKLGTSTICEQRNWANGNRQITWDGVSNYNSC